MAPSPLPHPIPCVLRVLDRGVVVQQVVVRLVDDTEDAAEEDLLVPPGPGVAMEPGDIRRRWEADEEDVGVVVVVGDGEGPGVDDATQDDARGMDGLKNGGGDDRHDDAVAAPHSKLVEGHAGDRDLCNGGRRRHGRVGAGCGRVAAKKTNEHRLEDCTMTDERS